MQSAPRIDSRITDEGRISGSFTQQEANDLSLKLRSGALPASLTYLEERTVGPSLGRDSIRAGVLASLFGLGLVVVFMLVFYKLSGVNAILAMAIDLLLLLAMMAYFGATMTLPGIAGFILTIGMGVDSNVLIFERIKEEIRGGQERPRRGRLRVRPRVPDDPRHARGVAHRGRLPVQLRHRADQGLRRDAHDWVAHQRVHVGVRLARALRARALGAQVARPEHLARVPQAPVCIFKNANYDFIRWRWHALVLSSS